MCLSFDVFGAERGNRPDGEARTGRSEPGFNYGSSWQARGRAGAAHRWRAEGVGRWRARGARGWATTGEWCPPGGEALGRDPGAGSTRNSTRQEQGHGRAGGRRCRSRAGRALRPRGRRGARAPLPAAGPHAGGARAPADLPPREGRAQAPVGGQGEAALALLLEDALPRGLLVALPLLLPAAHRAGHRRRRGGRARSRRAYLCSISTSRSTRSAHSHESITPYRWALRKK